MEFRRFRQVCKYGWKDAKVLSKEEGSSKGRWNIFCDILQCFFKYNVWSNQYKKEQLHLLSGEQKKEICLKYQEKNNKRDRWVKEFFDTYRFLNKWSKFKYETSASLQEKRNLAYNKHYKLDNKVFFEYGVVMQRHHYVEGTIVIGQGCKILTNVTIDYTGGLTIENHVSLSDNVKILTHNHDINFDSKDLGKGYILTPLTICDHVWIGTRAIIMPGVKEIGRGAIISADAYVNSKIPPYAVVMGNPAKIVGFKFTPEEMQKHEETLYSSEERTNPEKYELLYNKYFVNRIAEIKKHISI